MLTSACWNPFPLDLPLEPFPPKNTGKPTNVNFPVETYGCGESFAAAVKLSTKPTAGIARPIHYFAAAIT